MRTDTQTFILIPAELAYLLNLKCLSFLFSVSILSFLLLSHYCEVGFFLLAIFLSLLFLTVFR